MKGKASSAYRSIAFVIGSERKKIGKLHFFEERSFVFHRNETKPNGFVLMNSHSKHLP